MDKKAVLGQAYQGAVYQIDVPRMAVQPGIANLILVELLEAGQVESWAIITADNPQSELLPDKENKRRFLSLQKAVKALGKPAFKGFGLDPNGRWPPERNLLILGLSNREAIELGRKFGQLAIVWGGMDGIGVVSWC